MINLFDCVDPSMKAKAANLLYHDSPVPFCSSSILTVKAFTALSLRMAANIFHLVFHIALLVVWIMLVVVPPITNWVDQYHERMEEQGEGAEGDVTSWSFHLWNIWREFKLVASVQLEDDEVRHSPSPTPVPDLSERLQELDPVIAKLDEEREWFEPILAVLGIAVYYLPEYRAYRLKRAAVNKVLLYIRRAQTPPGKPLPGSLRRENAVTRSAFLNGDTRPREECFDSDEETTIGDDYY